MSTHAILNNGAAMPLVGLGTNPYGAFHYDENKKAICTAIQVGYRHFDTASFYNSEAFLGEALWEAMQAGIVKREDLFITSKLWVSDAYPEGVLPALQKSLSSLKLDYLDLYLIHFPIRLKEDARIQSPKSGDLLPLDIRGIWRAMEACVRKGLTRAIGVSNFSSKKVGEILEVSEIPPAVNQVEMHPKWQQQQLRETCKRANVHVSASSPLGAAHKPKGSSAIMDNPTVKEISLKHNKSQAQVLLRWALDKGVSVIPKSFNKERMIENLRVFDWSLDDEDHHKMSGIEQKKNFNYSLLCIPDGPYKSVEEFWDGEI